MKACSTGRKPAGRRREAEARGQAGLGLRRVARTPAAPRARPRFRGTGVARAARGRPQAANSMCVRRKRRGARRRGAGRSATRPAASAAQPCGEGAAVAGGIGARADRGAEIHDRLRVGRDARRRRRGLRERPELLQARRGLGGLLDQEHAREHALHVAVEDRVTLSAREREDRARRRAADARQLQQRVERCPAARRRVAPRSHRPRDAGFAPARSNRARTTGASPRPAAQPRASRRPGIAR